MAMEAIVLTWDVANKGWRYNGESPCKKCGEIGTHNGYPGPPAAAPTGFFREEKQDAVPATVGHHHSCAICGLVCFRPI